MPKKVVAKKEEANKDETDEEMVQALTDRLNQIN
jgi:hypothetical protein